MAQTHSHEAIPEKKNGKEDGVEPGLSPISEESINGFLALFLLVENITSFSKCHMLAHFVFIHALAEQYLLECLYFCAVFAIYSPKIFGHHPPTPPTMPSPSSLPSALCKLG